eukprot:5530376-Pyramimonas_sp.AAC.1
MHNSHNRPTGSGRLLHPYSVTYSLVDSAFFRVPIARLAPAPGICPLVSHDWPPRRVYAPLSRTMAPRV